jgi:hypothetical protein
MSEEVGEVVACTLDLCICLQLKAFGRCKGCTYCRQAVGSVLCVNCELGSHSHRQSGPFLDRFPGEAAQVDGKDVNDREGSERRIGPVDPTSIRLNSRQPLSLPYQVLLIQE